MTETTITVYYNGKWKEEEGLHQWISEKNDKHVVIVTNTEIKLAELIEKLCLKLKVDKLGRHQRKSAREDKKNNAYMYYF